MRKFLLILMIFLQTNLYGKVLELEEDEGRIYGQIKGNVGEYSVENNKITGTNLSGVEGGLIGIGPGIFKTLDNEIILDNIISINNATIKKECYYGEEDCFYVYGVGSGGEDSNQYLVDNNKMTIKNSKMKNFFRFSLMDEDLAGIVRNNTLSIENSQIQGITKGMQIFIRERNFCKGTLEYDDDTETSYCLDQGYKDDEKYKLTFDDQGIKDTREGEYIIEGNKINISSSDLTNISNIHISYQRDRNISKTKIQNNKISIVNSNITFTNPITPRADHYLGIQGEISISAADNDNTLNNEIFIKDSIIKNAQLIKTQNDDKITIENTTKTSIDATLQTKNLEVRGTNVEIKNIKDIQNLNLLANKNELKSEDDSIIKLTGTDETKLNLKKLSVIFNGDGFKEQEKKVWLIKKINATNFSSNAEKLDENSRAIVGVDEYDPILKSEEEGLYLTLNKKSSLKIADEVEISTFSQISNLSSALKSNNIIKNQISSIAKDQNLSADNSIVFAYVDGYKTRYKNANNTKGQLYTAGVASKTNETTLGFFTQYGTSKFDENYKKSLIDIKSKIYDIGILARSNFSELYAEGFAKIGQTQNKNRFNFASLKQVDKKSTQTFYSAGVYFGGKQQISQNITFDNKFGFSHTRISGDILEINGANLNLKAIKSNLAEISNTLSFDFNKILAFIGTRFEYEFDAVSSIASTSNIYSKDYKGFSYGTRVGFGLNVAKNSLISLEGSLIEGKRKEKSAQIGFVYKF